MNNSCNKHEYTCNEHECIRIEREYTCNEHEYIRLGKSVYERSIYPVLYVFTLMLSIYSGVYSMGACEFSEFEVSFEEVSRVHYNFSDGF